MNRLGDLRGSLFGTQNLLVNPSILLVLKMGLGCQ